VGAALSRMGARGVCAQAVSSPSPSLTTSPPHANIYPRAGDANLAVVMLAIYALYLMNSLLRPPCTC
jgi:hypothetical protein